MKEDAEQLKDWTFKVDEISANVYRVWGIDNLGRSVEKIGTDPDALLMECKADALKMGTRQYDGGAGLGQLTDL